MSRPFRIVSAGDASLIVMFDDGHSADARRTAVATAAAIAGAALPDVLDVVPTMHSVGVYFDPVHTDAAHLSPFISDLANGATPLVPDASRVIVVPVCYGGIHGPDLDAVAAFGHLAVDEVVARHTGPTYNVGMLGFAPGFAYMTTVDASIAMPRRSTPRTRVPAGSVGIAGTQTGIYPFESPGGWQLIGRTPLRACDFSRPDPFLFAPGDLVKFEPINAGAFDRLLADRRT